MSSLPEPMLPEWDDPQSLDLIQKITAKTRSNKIKWKKTKTGLTASVSGKIQLGFVRGSGIFLPKDWALFTIRDENGNEILRVENTLGGFRRPEPEIPPLRKAVETLYAAVEQLGRAEVEKAIELIDKI